jgi:shikimate dehydrogenase
MTEKVGLIGWPVAHSVSPAMHNAAFAALGLDWQYDLLPVRPRGLARSLAALIKDGYRGFNVTVPYKQAVLRLKQVEEVEASAAEIGAANTLTVIEGGGLRASNTDWHGFLDDLTAHAIDIQGMKSCLLGTGGSSKGVAYALRQAGAEAITCVSRKPTGKDTIGYSDFAGVCASFDLIVNCTPVGMPPRINESPWPQGAPFPKGAILIDLVYNPPVTRLMRDAQAAGAQTIGGMGMLVRQGALSFEQWTGLCPPLDVMESAARQALH